MAGQYYNSVKKNVYNLWASPYILNMRWYTNVEFNTEIIMDVRDTLS